MDKVEKERLITLSDIKKAAKIIKGGGLVVFPSDTVYILAVDPSNQNAVEKLLSFKNRWTGKAISIAVADKKMAEKFVKLNDNTKNIYTNLLPGPFTVVSEGKHRVAKGIEAENGTLGIRIPDNQWIKELIFELGGPVTATSANLSGRTPNYSTKFIKLLSQKKQKMIDFIVDVGKLPNNKPSTVIDATEPEIKILRRGDLVANTLKTLISKSEKETEKIAEFILKRVLSSRSLAKQPIVFGLSGDLGCGKTVFSRRIGQLLGVKEKITSPTFTIYNEYQLADKKQFLTRDQEKIKVKFLHFDLYRLNSKHEFEEIEFIQQFNSSVKLKLIACIEWPENMGKDYMTKLTKIVSYIPINFKYIDQETREIKY